MKIIVKKRTAQQMIDEHLSKAFYINLKVLIAGTALAFLL